jgi:hypothetical protein
MMPRVPGSRSCSAKVGRLGDFGRRRHEVRLHAAGELPADDQAHLGADRTPVSDGRCGGFLGVRWAGVRECVLAGGTDEAVLAWAHPHGTPRSDEAGHMGNGLRLKLGWRDERSAVLP